MLYVRYVVDAYQLVAHEITCHDEVDERERRSPRHGVSTRPAN